MQWDTSPKPPPSCFWSQHWIWTQLEKIGKNMKYISVQSCHWILDCYDDGDGVVGDDDDDDDGLDEGSKVV